MGLFNLFKKKETVQPEKEVYTRYFVLAGVSYHDMPKVMKLVSSSKPTAEELENCFCDYLPGKWYSDKCNYQIEHGMFEGAIQIHMGQWFIGYIAESDLPEFYEILKHKICDMEVHLEGGKRYMLGKNGKMYEKSELLKAILCTTFEI